MLCVKENQYAIGRFLSTKHLPRLARNKRLTLTEEQVKGENIVCLLSEIKSLEVMLVVSPSQRRRKHRMRHVYAPFTRNRVLCY